MNRCRKFVTGLLAVLLAVSLASPAFAAASLQRWMVSTYDDGPRMTGNAIHAAPATHPYMEQINALDLEPRKNASWGEEYYQRLYAVVRDDMTNFERLWAVYDDIVVNYTTSANCVGYAVALQCAFQSLGFETYQMRGQVTTTGGGWTEHSWVGVNAGGKLLYFDANLPGRYGSPTQTYFGADPQAITSYKDACIQVLELEPSGNAWLLVEELPIPADLS